MNRKHTPPLLTLNFYQNVSNKSHGTNHMNETSDDRSKFRFFARKKKKRGEKIRKRVETRKKNGTHGFNESEERRRIPRSCGGAGDRDSRASGKRTRNETKGRRRRCEKDGAFYTQALFMRTGRRPRIRV